MKPQTHNAGKTSGYAAGSLLTVTTLTVVEVAAAGDEALDCDTPDQLTAAQQAANLPPTG